VPGSFGAPSAALGISPAGSNDHPSKPKSGLPGTPIDARNRLNFDYADATLRSAGYAQMTQLEVSCG
jgi:hypothetical protein